MPTPSKRIQVLLRRPIQERLEEFAEQEGLSSSKAVARLVEEAMAARGLLSTPFAAHVIPESVQKHPNFKPFMENAAAAKAAAVTQNTSAGGDDLNFTQKVHQNIAEHNLQQAAKSQPSDDDADDMTELLKMAKKLKALKEAGIL